MAKPTHRRARSGDGLVFVRLHEELGKSYADLAPELFRRPVTAGLVAETWHRSPMSMPFRTERMGYAERSVNLRKPLG